MLLTIDIGNSFVKWDYGHGVRHAPLAEVLAAPLHFFSERPDAVAIANVAGADVRATLGAALAPWNAPLYWIASEIEGHGVRNGYERPEQLGVDRWLALIAARAEMRGACVVACVGTALTVDVLRADGVFAGGLIAPGPALMRAALAQGAAALMLTPGQYSDMPTNTADAVESGVVHALCGAIERMVSIQQRDSEAPVALLLSGGAADWLSPRLNTPHRVVDNLPLRGLRIVAQQEGWL